MKTSRIPAFARHMECSAVSSGFFSNLILFTTKALAGFFSHSIAITADAFNNLSDAGSSVVTLVGFKLGGTEGRRWTPLRPRPGGVPGGAAGEPDDPPGWGWSVGKTSSREDPPDPEAVDFLPVSVAFWRLPSW